MRNMCLAITCCAWLFACQPQAPSADANKSAAAAEITKASLKSADEKINYAVGVEIGKNITRNGLPLNDAIFMKGIRDGMEENKEPLLTEDEMRQVKTDHSKAQREKREKEREEQGNKNKAEGEKFLKENAAKEGVVTTASGLQYKILKESTGEKPKETDRVSVNYRGTLMDGKEFDSSYKRNKPASFGVNRVVKGWTEALQLMPVGSKWQLFIPPELGYGERGAGGDIGPNAVLIFEVELLEIEKEDPNKPKTPGSHAEVVPNPVKRTSAPK